MTTTLTTAIQSSLKYLAVIVFGMALGFYLRGVNGCGKQSGPLPLAADSNTQARAEYKTAKDTSYSIFEMPFKTHLKPGVIYTQKAKGNYANETLQKDLITGIRAEKSGIEINTFNPADSILKEYHFDNPGRSFTIQSQNGNLFVKSNDFYIRTLSLISDFRFQNSDFKNPDKYIGLQSRLEWKDRFEIQASVLHPLEIKPALNNLEFNLQLNYTLIK